MSEVSILIIGGGGGAGIARDTAMPSSPRPICVYLRHLRIKKLSKAGKSIWRLNFFWNEPGGMR